MFCNMGGQWERGIGTCPHQIFLSNFSGALLPATQNNFVICLWQIDSPCLNIIDSFFEGFCFLIFIYLALSHIIWDLVLWHMVSLIAMFKRVVACGLSYSMACGILVPRSGIKPMSPALQDRFLTIGPQGSPSRYHL